MTAGGLLKEARQAAGMHIAALAVALKVPVSKLEALEADNYAVLPDTVFVRALASSVCRTLKIDAAPILSLLPQSQSPRLSVDSAGINAPVKGSAGKSSASSAASFAGSGSGSRSMVLVVLALLLGAVVLFYVPRHSAPSDTADPAPVAVPDALPANTSEPAPPVLATPPAMERPADSSASAAPAAAVAASSPVSATPSVAVSPAAASGVTTSNVAAADGAADAAAGPLVLRARSASWVQVRDANGALALQRNLAAGETVSVSAPTPLAVIVGRADATEVTVRGKPFDLTAVARENVARFEVK
ncbi:cytoskeleton protein RodZ [Acidovorax delafieldii]|uniref:Cytoskeleton protein RodZ n=2 Tax=Acidovorax delafieldii TaxID=47920 RepID=A0AAJ2BQB5_ACIDE|nr:RodZ domain-containing protein [Acidovorax delafieldii]MDR6765936.1 cytoskeleton protein RodZ [Acidovorax delafieldii]MDR6837126.1 cytoskeleton protein RodZ [Acidovorax delafieldii]MDR7366617.1 cytoskeleton protein RodZ [Acidovorax delafieldii]